MNIETGEWNCLKTEEDGGSVEDLLTKLGKKIEASSIKVAPRATERKPPPPLEDDSKVYRWHDQMLAAQPARVEYLTAQRGLSLDTINKFKLGHDGQRFTIPVRFEGKWVNVRRYRPNADAKKKMLNLPDHGAAVLAFSEVLSAGNLPVLLVEGEFDALLANQIGEGEFVAVTGTGGAATLPAGLDMLSNREVFVLYDNDEAGKKGAKKVAAALGKLGADVHVLDWAPLGLLAGDKSRKDFTDWHMKLHGTAVQIINEMQRVRSGASPARERFRVVSASELAEPVPPMRWLVEGVWPDGSYGVVAGEKKTLKTYTALALALSVASGEPYLDRFAVPEPRPVLMYLGEGGQFPTMRRLQRIAQSMGVDLRSLPLRMVFDAGDLTGETFLAAFEEAVAEETPGLVIIDPLYAFHPPGVEAQNLYDRGAMLAELQQMVPDGASFLLADHFRKTGGKDLDLDSIAQSGVAQWADSWILQNHHTRPRVDEGEFSIGMQFGSRQWGGQQYIVDWSIGRFDAAAGEHLGELQVAVRAVGWGEKPPSRLEGISLSIAKLVRQNSFEYTREQVLQAVSGATAAKRAAFDELAETGELEPRETQRAGKDGKQRAVKVWGYRRLSESSPSKVRLSPPEGEAAVEADEPSNARASP
ncbi:AAA family ATPase [Agromyces mediolanus]|nr:AAA family ATPase [Agromyces mediolanus]